MNMVEDLYELSLEISAISRIITGLSNQLDNEKTDSLNPENLSLALLGVSRYLDRITEDLNSVDELRLNNGRNENV